MKSNYKPLGDFIEEINIKNKDLKEDNLLGVSISKKFIPSIANTHGTNFKNYKVIKYNQFAYGPVTSRNGDKISIALLKEKSGIISSSYKVFKIIDEKILCPDYLMLWFEREEFDRYARFKSHGSVREIFSWEELSNTLIPVPDIEIQQKIVKIDKVIRNRIRIKEELNNNLMSMADSIFQEKFCNFSHYDENELNYSDFGYIPENWNYKTLDEISEVTIGKTPPRKEKEWFSETDGIKWVSIKDLGSSGTYIFDTTEYLTKEAVEKFNVNIVPKDTVILSFKLTVGRISITTEDMVTNEAIAHFKLNDDTNISKEYLYLYLKNFNYETLGSTSSIAKAINSKIVKKIPVLVPKDEDLEWFSKNMENLFNTIKNNQIEINNLTKIRDTLLPKLMSGEIDVSEVNCDL